MGLVSHYGGSKWEMARSRERARAVRSDLTLSYQYRHETAIITHLVIFLFSLFLLKNLQDWRLTLRFSLRLMHFFSSTTTFGQFNSDARMSLFWRDNPFENLNLFFFWRTLEVCQKRIAYLTDFYFCWPVLRVPRVRTNIIILKDT